MDDSIDDVEEAIRRAEELMSKGMEMLQFDELPKKHLDNNRYSDPDAKEDLIQKLLHEREYTLRAHKEAEELAEEIKFKEIERQVMMEEETSVTEPPIRIQLSEYVTLNNINRTAEPRHSGFARKSKDEIKREVEDELVRNCTFKPVINEKVRVKAETIEERVERLSHPKSDYWVQKDNERMVHEQEELGKICTFKPDISLTKNTYGTKDETWQKRVKEAYRTNVPVEERLHEDASERWAAREKAKEELEKAELDAQSSFRPRMNPISEEIAKQIGYEPLQKRATRIQRDKNERLAKLQMEVEANDPNLTFKPTISETSERIAQSMNLRKGVAPSRDVVTRLMSHSEVVAQRKNKREQAWAQQQDLNNKFVPKASMNSNKLLEQNPDYRDLDFVKRQEKWIEKRLKKESELRIAQGVAENATFTPSIGNSEAVLIHARPERMTETREERFERLAVRDQDHKNKVADLIREHYYGQYNYKPKINKVSEAIAKESNRDDLYQDLYQNSRGRQFKELAQSQLQEELLKECTFKPRILRRTGGTASDAIKSLGVDADHSMKLINESKRLREKKLLQMRREQEFNELQECTFAPSVNENIPKQPTGPVVVRGLGRYLELQELAKQQQTDLETRQKKAFMTELTDELQACTIPKPFKLSSAPRSSRIKAKNQVERQCTFKPKTNLTKDRNQIRKILATKYN